ncbi:MAG: hypothetical protein ACK55F_09440 [Acidobacteriota bacterium]
MRLIFALLLAPPAVAAPGSYRILLQPTPCSVGPCGADHYRASLGHSAPFQKAGYIVADQDVRGRYLSQGTWAEVRPHNPAKGVRDTNESTDTTRSTGSARTSGTTTANSACGASPARASTSRPA